MRKPLTLFALYVATVAGVAIGMMVMALCAMAAENNQRRM